MREFVIEVVETRTYHIPVDAADESQALAEATDDFMEASLMQIAKWQIDSSVEAVASIDR
jgi:hypothetical protein